MKEIAMGKVYNFTLGDDYWYKTWKENDLFRVKHKIDQPSFSILLPPTHEILNNQLSEAFTAAVADILMRRKKMQGYNTLYLPGLNVDGNTDPLVSRLGLAWDWEQVQLLHKIEFPQLAARIFVQLYREGYIYRDDYRRRGDTNTSKQWFLKISRIAKFAVEAVEKGKIAFIPEIGEKEYFHWMNNIQDWCISRQLPVGYPIPVYYCGDCRSIIVNEVIPEKCDRCHSTSINQVPDVLDTYFLSALWPFAALGWQEQTPDFKFFYPTSLIIINRNMIFFQAARMIMMGIYISKNIPFREVLIGGRIQYEEKVPTISENSPDDAPAPLTDIIAKYGVDALRFALASLAVPGQDTFISTARLKSYKAFANKIWNASRYVLGHSEEDNFALENVNIDFSKITDVDRWILHGLNNIIVNVNDLIDTYKLHKAAHLIARFFHCEYCNWYLEFSRHQMDNPNTLEVLRFSLSRLLLLLHPFMPFITEEIYHQFNPGQEKFLIQTAFPVFSSELVFPGEFADVEVLKKVIKETRKTRTENRLDSQMGITVFLKSESNKEKKILTKNMRYFNGMAGSVETHIVTDFAGLPRGFKGSCPNWEILLPLMNDEDRFHVLARLETEAEILESRIADLENKLPGSDVMDKTHGPEITGFKKSLRANLNRRDKVRKTINDLS